MAHRFAFLAFAAFAAAPAFAQYPTRPIQLVIPFAAGGGSRLSGRNPPPPRAKDLHHRPILPVNRVGASGAIGSTIVKNAPKDGYTLLVARIGSHAIYPA